MCRAARCLLARAPDERQGAALDRQWCDGNDGWVGARAGASDLPAAHSSTWARDFDRLHRPEDVPLSDEAGMLDMYRCVLVGVRNMLNRYRLANVLYST